MSEHLERETNELLKRILRLLEHISHIPTRIRIEEPMPATLLVGQTVSVSAVETDAQNKPVTITDTLNWTIADGSMASYADGVVTAIAAGSTSITVTDPANSLTATDTVTVTDVATAIAIDFGTPA